MADQPTDTCSCLFPPCALPAHSDWPQSLGWLHADGLIAGADVDRTVRRFGASTSRAASAGAAGRSAMTRRRRRQAARHRVADAVAGQTRRTGLSAHRPAQGRFRQGRGHDVRQPMPRASHPAGRGDADRGRDRHGRALRRRLGATRSSASPRRNVRRVVANPLDIRATRPNSSRSRSRCRRRSKSGGNAGARQLRATGRARQEQQAARRQRPAHRPYRRLAVAIRVRPARQRHPPGAAARAAA